MATFNPDFWEVPTNADVLENIPFEKALWYESEEDRQRRYAFQDFFTRVMPVVRDLAGNRLTPRQRQILELYYFHGKTQEEIAETLKLTQSTVSRHLFGTVREGKRVGGAIPKLRKALERDNPPQVTSAWEELHSRLAQAS